MGQGSQLVFPEAEHSEVDEVPDLIGQIIQSITIHIQVGQLGEGADRVWEEGEVVLSQNQLLEGYASAEQ